MSQNQHDTSFNSKPFTVRVHSSSPSDQERGTFIDKLFSVLNGNHIITFMAASILSNKKLWSKFRGLQGSEDHIVDHITFILR